MVMRGPTPSLNEEAGLTTCGHPPSSNDGVGLRRVINRCRLMRRPAKRLGQSPSDMRNARLNYQHLTRSQVSRRETNSSKLNKLGQLGLKKCDERLSPNKNKNRFKINGDGLTRVVDQKNKGTMILLGGGFNTLDQPPCSNEGRV